EILPPVTATFDDAVALVAAGQPARTRVVLRASTPAGAQGTLRLAAPAGFTVQPAQVPFTLTEADPEAIVELTLTAKAGAAAGALAAQVEVAGRKTSWRRAVIDYPHLPRRTLLEPSTLRLVPIDLKRGPGRIAYVPGPGDKVAQALRQVGYQVEEIDEDAIATGDLRRFDAVVMGIRAYNTRPRLLALHGPLMAYVEGGGRLIVQYNTNNRFNPLKAEIGPEPFEITRDRVTDEAATMEPVDPAHPALTTPNRLGPADFAGWVQERGLYFAANWGPAYRPIFRAHDAGEPPLEGGLLVARHGKGVFVYTGLAFFRQLPAGVPGAYRLFANLLAL
ncbi:MAG: PIG-L family deacetylase, partial [Myxococcales bacterium]|nr:PIG-L family deacetylase [Myxococcales bacterium]